MSSRPEPDYRGAGRAVDGETQGPVRQVPVDAGAVGPHPLTSDAPQGEPNDSAPTGTAPTGAPQGEPTGTAPTDAHEVSPEVLPSDGQLAAEGSEILADVAALSAERDEYLGALQRLKADFDNYRKRVARLQEEQAARAAVDLVGKLLPVLDNLDLACAHLGGEDAGSEEARALGQARRQLLDVLAKEGLERVDEVDVPFDPVVHDAVAHAPASDDGAEAGDGSAEAAGGNGEHAVDEVMRAGYRWRGQVVRPAMVRVRG